MLPSNQKNEKEYFWNGGYEIVVYCLTIHLEPEPFYFWKVGAGAAENRAAPKLCFLGIAVFVLNILLFFLGAYPPT